MLYLIGYHIPDGLADGVGQSGNDVVAEIDEAMVALSATTREHYISHFFFLQAFFIPAAFRFRCLYIRKFGYQLCACQFAQFTIIVVNSVIEAIDNTEVFGLTIIPSYYTSNATVDVVPSYKRCRFLKRAHIHRSPLSWIGWDNMSAPSPIEHRPILRWTYFSTLTPKLANRLSEVDHDLPGLWLAQDCIIPFMQAI